LEIQLWKETLAPYELAVQELIVKFQYMIREYRQAGLYSPIEQVDGRVKTLSSILEKANKKGIPVEEAVDRIEDIAGIRLTCQFVEDITKVSDIIRSRRDMVVVDEVDYITNRKKSGYRSYHMIVNYEVQTIYGIKRIPVEIQIRTMAMNFWATIEHSLQYKYKGNVPEHIRERLSNSAEAVLSLDSEMSSIREEVMAAQQLFREKANVVADILNNIQALYRSENKEAMLNIQDEFYNLYKTGTLEELEDFCSRLDAIAARRNVQKLN
jgi:putative GTP pyrophosphokinase